MSKVGDCPAPIYSGSLYHAFMCSGIFDHGTHASCSSRCNGFSDISRSLGKIHMTSVPATSFPEFDPGTMYTSLFGVKTVVSSRLPLQSNEPSEKYPISS